MVKVTADNFDTEVLQAGKVAVVDFWAEWCGPCRMFAPTFEEVSKELEDRVVFAKLNVDEAESIAVKYKVMTIPTVMIFKNGAPAKKSVGVLNKADLSELIKSVL